MPGLTGLILCLNARTRIHFPLKHEDPWPGALRCFSSCSAHCWGSSYHGHLLLASLSPWAPGDMAVKADFPEKCSDSSGLSGAGAVTHPLCMTAAEGTFIPDVFPHRPQLGKII